MKPLRPRYARIDRSVTELLSMGRVVAAPVPVEDIAGRLGASLRYEHFQNEVSGLLMRGPNGVIIAVERDQPTTRQRFTIAHEIGHLVLHDQEEVRIDRSFPLRFRSQHSSSAEDVEEIEANAFAASLLMPAALLRREMHGLALDIEDEEQIRRLASRYQVSLQAMTYRLLNLSSWRKAD